VLLFGREPQRFVAGGFSIYSSYPGQDRSDPFAKRFEIAGTLLDQARRLQEFLDAEAVTLFDKTNRKAPNAEKYPRRALQEAMINALAHRDYSLLDPTRLTSFSNRIEIVSPGSLPYGVTLDDLRKRAVTPRWRNQSLAWFLSRLQLAQAEGQGILTIRRTMKAAGCPPPRFDATEVSVSCILRAHPRFRTIKIVPPAKSAKKKKLSKAGSSKRPRSLRKKAPPSPKRNRRG
jgi:ATP-dependent DNA helicase RecG